MSDLQFPHWSTRFVNDDKTLTREGHRFLLGLWARTGSGSATTVNSEVSGTASGTYGATEQQMLNDLASLANQIRLIMVNNGIAV